MKHIALFFLCTFLLAGSVFAYESMHAPQGFVFDSADLLSAEDELSLEVTLSSFERDTRHEIAVVTVTSLDGRTIEGYAAELFSEFGIGQKNADNGVLLLVAPNDRKVRIEVGYGLEGVLTDAQSHSIIQNAILPFFRRDDYSKGIHTGLDAIMKVTQGEYVPSNIALYDSSFLKVLGYALLALFVIISIPLILFSSKPLAGGILAGIMGVMYFFTWFKSNVGGSGIHALIYIGGVGLLGYGIHRVVYSFKGVKKLQKKIKKKADAGYFAFMGINSSDDFKGGFGGGSSGGGGATGSW